MKKNIERKVQNLEFVVEIHYSSWDLAMHKNARRRTRTKFTGTNPNSTMNYKHFRE